MNRRIQHPYMPHIEAWSGSGAKYVRCVHMWVEPKLFSVRFFFFSFSIFLPFVQSSCAPPRHHFISKMYKRPTTYGARSISFSGRLPVRVVWTEDANARNGCCAGNVRRLTVLYVNTMEIYALCMCMMRCNVKSEWVVTSLDRMAEWFVLTAVASEKIKTRRWKRWEWTENRKVYSVCNSVARYVAKWAKNGDAFTSRVVHTVVMGTWVSVQFVEMLRSIKKCIYVSLARREWRRKKKIVAQVPEAFTMMMIIAVSFWRWNEECREPGNVQFWCTSNTE